MKSRTPHYTKAALVTGGAGFIGSHLCERLLAEGYHVVCLDNFFTGTHRNVRQLRKHEQFELLRADVTSPFQVDCDLIFNLACPASPVHYQHDPVRTLQTSVYGAFNALTLARQLRIPILHASTSEVYGDPLEHPQTEKYWGNVNPIGPRSCYDEGKRAAETLFFDFRRLYGVDTKVFRIFNTYGPRMHPDDGRVVSNFIVRALRGEDIEIYGDGSQTRSFCFVEDLVDGIMALAASSRDCAGPINLGNPDERTIREIAELIIELTGSESKICFLPKQADDPRRRKPDISLASETLDWRPKVPLRDGLEQTIAYFRGLLGAELAA